MIMKQIGRGTESPPDGLETCGDRKLTRLRSRIGTNNAVKNTVFPALGTAPLLVPEPFCLDDKSHGGHIRPVYPDVFLHNQFSRHECKPSHGMAHHHNRDMDCSGSPSQSSGP